MTGLGHQSRSPEWFPFAVMGHAKRELTHNGRQHARGADHFGADNFLCGASAFQGHLVGVEIKSNTAVVTLDGSDAIDVDFRRHRRFDQVYDRRHNPRTHLASPPSCNVRGYHAPLGTLREYKCPQPDLVTISRKNNGNSRNKAGTRDNSFAIQPSPFACGSSPFTKQTAILLIKFNAASVEHRNISTHTPWPLKNAIDTAPSSVLVALEEKNSCGCGITKTSSERLAA